MSIISTNPNMSFAMPSGDTSLSAVTQPMVPIDFTVTKDNRGKIGYIGAVGEVLVIPETFTDPDDGKLYRVTIISDAAFYQCESLTSINIPNGVTSIGNAAFFSCTSLTSVTIGNGVTSIDDNVFQECTNLRSINIDKPVGSITGSPWGAPVANAVKWLR